MGHYDSCSEVLTSEDQFEKSKLEKEKRDKVIQYIFDDMQRRTLDAILANIVLDPVGYRKKCLNESSKPS